MVCKIEIAEIDFILSQSQRVREHRYQWSHCTIFFRSVLARRVNRLLLQREIFDWGPHNDSVLQRIVQYVPVGVALGDTIGMK